MSMPKPPIPAIEDGDLLNVYLDEFEGTALVVRVIDEHEALVVLEGAGPNGTDVNYVLNRDDDDYSVREPVYDEPGYDPSEPWMDER